MTANSSESSPYSVFKQDGSHQFYCRWTVEEDLLLSKAVAEHGPHKWTLISKFISGRTAVQCSTRWFGALNPNVHKGRWASHEDHALTEAVHYFQSITKSSSSLPWNRIAENIPHRTGIQCQARWTEALDPAVRKGRWHPDEDKLLAVAIAQYGCCWIRVAGMIPTRTQRQCRTRWNQIHSQQLKAASTKGFDNSNNNNNNKRTSFEPIALPPLNVEFIPHQTQSNNSPTSPAYIDNILAQYGSSSSTTTSRSSSYSSSPPALSFPASPLYEKNNLLQHDYMFPVLNNNNSSSSAANFLYSTDFDFLLNYGTSTPQQ